MYKNLYTGYGIFGGMDFFQLVAEMNHKKTREEGIEIYHTQDEKTAVFPNLVHSLNHWKWINKKPVSCPHQGYFY